MAKVTNAYTTYTATAIREDLSDVIYNIDPFDTPVFTMAGTRNVGNVVYDWQEDSLAAVDTNNAEVEGFETSRAASTPTTRRTAVCQISHKNATVSGTQQVTNNAGKRKEMAYQIAKKGKELKKDMESIGFGTVQDEVLGNDTTARKTFAFENWLDTNTDRGATGADGDPAAKTPVTDGTQRAFTEDLLKTVIKSCWDNGGEPSWIVLGSFLKQVASGFTGRSNTREMIKARSVVATVSLYASDFGDFRILPARHVRTRSALLLDPRYFRIAYLRKFVRQELGRVGDAETVQIISEWGLQVDNTGAHGIVADLTDS